MPHFEKTLLVQVEAASNIHGGHLSVSLCNCSSLQALAIRGGTSGRYPLIRTPVVLLVVLGRAGWYCYQTLLGTTGVPLVSRGARWLLHCRLIKSL